MAIALTDERGLDVPVRTTDNKDNTFRIDFEPKTVGAYTASVFFAEQEIPSSPYRINVDPSIDVGKVRVEGLEESKYRFPFLKLMRWSLAALVFPSYFDAGFNTVESCDLLFRSNFLVDNYDFIFSVKKSSFDSSVGHGPPHLLSCVMTRTKLSVISTRKVFRKTSTKGFNTFHDVCFSWTKFFLLWEALFSLFGQIPHFFRLPAHLSSDALLTRTEVPIGKVNEFDIITTGAGKGEVRVNLISPTGRMFPARVEETIDGFAAKYTCYEQGPHKIAITFGGQPVPGSPFTVKAFPPKAPAPPKGDPSKVKAYGPGLKGGIANTPADFTIDTRNAGPGGLGLTIEGPCEAKIECFDKGDGTCDVRYWPTEPGEYNINILFADKPIPGAPFKAQINPSKRVDVSNIKAYGPGIQPTGKFERLPDRNVWHAHVHYIRDVIFSPMRGAILCLFEYH